MTLSRREFMQTSGGDGRLAGMGRHRPARRASSGASGASSIPKAWRRAIPIRTASSCGHAGRLTTGKRHVLTVEVAEDEAFRRVVAHAPAPVSAASDWTTRVLVGGLKPARTYWYRFTDARRERQPHRPHHHRAAAERSAPGQFRLRQLPGRQRGQAQRLSPDDLRGRARRARGPARLRASPRRLHLRGRRISRRSEDPLRPHHLRGRAHSRRRQGRQLSFPADGRRLSRRLQRLSRAIPICRTPARAGRSSPCGTITNSRGRAGRASSKRAASRGQAKASRSPPTRPGGNICRRAARSPAEHPGNISKRPRSQDVEIEKWDENGLGDEPNNLIAINSLIGYRTFRYGKHLDLIITDQHSYRSADPFSDDSLE